MKVTPSNQTLILAGERGAQGGKSAKTVGQALGVASNGAVLQRVTMVTAFPDSTLVYVHADYASLTDAAPDNVVATQSKSVSPRAQAQDENVSDGTFGASSGGGALVPRISGTSKDAYGNPQTVSQVGLSSHLRPEEQYAQTQRILADKRPTANLDVHA